MSLPATRLALPHVGTPGNQGSHPAARPDQQVRGVFRRRQCGQRSVRSHDVHDFQRRDVPGLSQAAAAPTDHFLEEWFWRPAAIASYSAGRLSGTRSSYAWHNTLSEMRMVVISSTLTVGPIAETLNETGEPIGNAGAALERAFARVADDLGWWTEAAKSQRVKRAPPY